MQESSVAMGRFVPITLAMATAVALQSGSALAFTDEALIDGFVRTVFGSEYRTLGWQSSLVKKFTGPVRFHIDDRTSSGRAEVMKAFVLSLPGLIEGLEVSLADDPAAANFRIFIVNRRDYQRVVSEAIYDRPSASFAPGKCLVRVVSTVNGIERSDAVLVGDEGDFLFRRCMVEEVLQGLGPVNDDPGLSESVFNDGSKHSTVTDFDRYLLNALYHPTIKPGMTELQVRRILPDIVSDLRRRLD